MKKGIFILLAMMSAVFMTLPALADRKGHGSYHERSTRDRDDSREASWGSDKGDRERDRDRYKDRQRDREHDSGYDHRKPGRHPQGYRSQPRGRHYGNPHRVKGRSYRYDGHWNSYAAWEKYRRLHPERFNQGRYYRQESHLYFRFCDPVGSACFFFSIGR